MERDQKKKRKRRTIYCSTAHATRLLVYRCVSFPFIVSKTWGEVGLENQAVTEGKRKQEEKITPDVCACMEFVLLSSLLLWLGSILSTGPRSHTYLARTYILMLCCVKSVWPMPSACPGGPSSFRRLPPTSSLPSLPHSLSRVHTLSPHPPNPSSTGPCAGSREGPLFSTHDGRAGKQPHSFPFILLLVHSTPPLPPFRHSHMPFLSLFLINLVDTSHQKRRRMPACSLYVFLSPCHHPIIALRFSNPSPSSLPPSLPPSCSVS